MMTNCGCSLIINEPFEFKIQDCEKPQVYSNCLLLPNTNDEDLCTLHNKIIGEFLKVIKQLECGIQPDIEIILEEISLIYMNNCNYNVTKKMLATDPEEDNFLRHLNYLSEFATQEEKDLVLLNLGIYDKVNALVTREEVNTIVENKISEVTATVDELNKVLDTKIGYVARVDNYYYGFSNVQSYIAWAQSHDNRLILAQWQIGTQEGGSTPVVTDTSYIGNETGEFKNSDIESFERHNSKSFTFNKTVTRNSSTYIITTYYLSRVTQAGLDNVTSSFELLSEITYSGKLYRIYKWTHESSINLDLNITLV